MMRNTTSNDSHARIASRNAKQNSDSAKTHMLPAFAQTPLNENLRRHANANFSHPQRARRANRDAVSLLHWSKKFFHRPWFRGIASTTKHQKRANRVRLDSQRPVV